MAAFNLDKVLKVTKWHPTIRSTST